MNLEALCGVVFPELARISAIIHKLVDALIALQGKRITLEDKAIARTFLGLLDAYSQIVEALVQSPPSSIQALADLNLNAYLADLDSLTKLNASLGALLDDFLKAITYNLSYFEQYYEYDFATRLNKLDFQAQLLKTAAGLSCTCSGAKASEERRCEPASTGALEETEDA